MSGMGDGDFTGDESDLDAVLWVHGVDYLSGWRDAKEAAAELGDVLRLVGMGAAGVRLLAAAGADGSGVVRFELSAAVAREVAALAREAAARCRKAG